MTSGKHPSGAASGFGRERLGRGGGGGCGETPPTIAEALKQAHALFSERGLRSPREDAELILAWVLGRDRVFLHAHPETALTDQQSADFLHWTSRRAGSYPLQYMFGEQEFYGRLFKIDESTLIPRPETEVVVEEALRELDRIDTRPRRAVDVGTGSGCIAISLACQRPDLRVVGLDISAAALEVARANAGRLGCADRVEFAQSDALTGLAAGGPGFDLVVSNPPYVAWEKRHEVDLSVVLYEPPAAVFAGGGGLEVYEKLLVQARNVLKPGGRLVVELGYDLFDAVTSLAARLGWRLTSSASDLAGVVRCAVWEPTRRGF